MKGKTISTGLVHPLPVAMASMLMHYATLMTGQLQNLAVEIALDGRDGLWETACSSNSWLSACAQEHGIPARRINYQNGFDIYKEDTWQQLRHLRRQRRPHRLWFSVPCTKWCRWTSINYNTPEKREALETMRRKERRMLRQAVSFILESLDEDENISIYWEWTFPCSGWDQHPMISLERGLRERGQEWESCRIDGCCYGMKDEKESGFLLKKWMIRTNDPIFAKNFRFKCCPRNHQHVYIQGIETARSAYYPKKMVESIIRHWKRQMAPQRHLQLLADVPRDHVADEDEN